MIRDQSIISKESSSLAKDILAKLADRHHVCSLVSKMPPAQGLGTKRSWSTFGLAFGDPGLALAFGFLHRLHPHEGWDQVAHRYLQAAAHGLNSLSIVPLGLFDGVTGVASAVRYLSLGGTRYRKALATLDERLAALTESRLQSLPSEGGVPVSAYDVISGLTGVGRYFLEAAASNGRAEAALLTVLRMFVNWSLIPKIPGFFTPPHLVSDFEKDRDSLLASGYINCGLAHGVPGPLALMALALRSDVHLQHLSDAVHSLGHWLLGTIRDTSYGPDVPYYVPLSPSRIRLGVSRTAWCYGNPGAARALQLAGLALNDTVLQKGSLRLMMSVVERPFDVRNVPSATFCHGMAGVLQVVVRYLSESADPDTSLVRFGKTTLATILTHYKEVTAPGFQSNEVAGSWVKDPGLLEGLAGVALVLLGSSCETGASWDENFLLS